MLRKVCWVSATKFNNFMPNRLISICRGCTTHRKPSNRLATKASVWDGTSVVLSRLCHLRDAPYIRRHLILDTIHKRIISCQASSILLLDVIYILCRCSKALLLFFFFANNTFAVTFCLMPDGANCSSGFVILYLPYVQVIIFVLVNLQNFI